MWILRKKSSDRERYCSHQSFSGLYCEDEKDSTMGEESERVNRKLLTLRERKDAVLESLTALKITKRTDFGDFISYAFGSETMTIRTRINFNEPDLVVAYSYPEFFIPEFNREKALEYLNKRNYRSKFGCLEIEMETGEVRYRTSVRHSTCGVESLKSIMTQLLMLHKTYFARVIYPKLLLLREKDGVVPLDEDD